MVAAMIVALDSLLVGPIAPFGPEGVPSGIAKRPATMREKASRNGRVAVVEQFGELVGVSLEEVGGRHNHLAPVWENGKLLRDWSFDEVKARAQGAGL